MNRIDASGATGRRSRLLVGAAMAATTAVFAAPGVWAQDGVAAADASDDPDVIVVTSRKREETLQDVPIAITAFSADDIEDAEITGLEDVALLSAGFQFSNQGGQQPGRYNTQLRFRGQSTAQFSPTFATGAFFIDGIYVLNNATSLSLMDVERVEVIKGPQSAYFGRNTFGGAVNLITRDPNVDEYAAQVEATITDRERYDVSGIVDLPLAIGVSGLSLSGRFYDKEGHFTASNGESLGDERTYAFNAKFFAQPTPNFTFRARASYSEDNDGPPAAGFVSGDLNDTCTGTTLTRPDGTVANPVNYVCGEVPGINEAITFTGGPLIDGQTSIISPVAGNPDYFAEAIANFPLPDGVPQVTDIGLERETLRFATSATYELGEYDIDFNFGYNRQGANWVRDFDLSARDRWLSRDPQRAVDYSIEGRITSPQDQRLRWLAGVNYYSQEFTSSGGGGDAGTSCFTVFDNPLSGEPGSDDETGCIIPLAFPNSFQNTDESNVLGIFGGIDFDILQTLTLSLEGRFQSDELIKGGVITEAGLGEGARTIEEDSFLPRVILRWTPEPTTNLYASYAEGILQADLASSFFTNADERELTQYLEQFPTLSEVLPQEEITAYEIGFKKQLFDGRAQVNFAYYWNEWTGIKGRSTAVVNETCDAEKLGEAGCDFAGVMLGDAAMVDDGTGNLVPFFNSRNVLIPGDADLNGFELETLFDVTDNWRVSLNVAQASNEYTDYQFNFVEPFAGFSQMAGNQQPRYPEWTGNASTTYTVPLNATYDLYGRGDLFYFGEAFVDESNLAFTEDYYLVNLRFGLVSDLMRIEAFVNNVTDEDAYSAGARWTDFTRPTNFASLTLFQGVAVTPQDKREFGIRLVRDF